MAKKISKHSRAARRGLIDESSEAKDLAKIETPEDNQVKKSIIRTTIKNENLLNKKMENQRIKKNKKKTNNLKYKLERSTKLEGVLTSKIEQSIARAKFVQNSRKSGWDQINKGISIANGLIESPSEKSEEDLKREAEEEYVNEFFDKDVKSTETDPTASSSTNSFNKFSLLDEAEA